MNPSEKYGIVMGMDAAMATSRPFSFVRTEDEKDTEISLEEAVFQALGAASVCWDNVREAGEFNSSRAKAIGEALMGVIRRDLERAAGSGASTLVSAATAGSGEKETT